MQEQQSYIHYLKMEQPGIWASIQRAVEMGLIFVDEENDSVTATARLLLTYPDLHEVLNMLTENWIREKSGEVGSEQIHDLIAELKNHG